MTTAMINRLIMREILASIPTPANDKIHGTRIFRIPTTTQRTTSQIRNDSIPGNEKHTARLLVRGAPDPLFHNAVRRLTDRHRLSIPFHNLQRQIAGYTKHADDD